VNIYPVYMNYSLRKSISCIKH